jgi:hypothetical protein
VEGRPSDERICNREEAGKCQEKVDVADGADIAREDVRENGEDIREHIHRGAYVPNASEPRDKGVAEVLDNAPNADERP